MTSAPPDLPRRPPPRAGITARNQLLVAAAVGTVVGVVVALAAPLEFAPLAGWVAAAGTYGGWVWANIAGMDAERTAEWALREDPTRTAADLVLLVASVVSLGAVGLVLVEGQKLHGGAATLRIALAVLAVALSWAVVHTVYTLVYARLYYDRGDGGIDFNQRHPPRYTDFAYLAFTIGMTFQVSDTELQASGIRRAVLRQALLSYLFGAVILATTVNLVAGLGK